MWTEAARPGGLTTEALAMTPKNINSRKPKVDPNFLEEAQQAASILGYNYKSGDWYKRSYKVFNKKYKSKKIKKNKEMGLIRRKIKSLFE